MLKIEDTWISGWEATIRGMRNPKNSWDKSDSGFCDVNCQDGEKCPWNIDDVDCCLEFHIGENDMKLMKALAKAGSDHGKFLRMINVTVDITAPLYWWKEFDTYKVGTVANSCSTMHKIQAKEFELDDFSHEHLITDPDLDWENGEYSPTLVLKTVISNLNLWRKKFLKSNDKRDWWQMIQLLPSSYNQKRTIQFNYEVIRRMYHARKEHKLDEWRVTFCDWVRGLPYAKELIIGEE